MYETLKKQITVPTAFKNGKFGGTCLVQSVRCPALDLSSGSQSHSCKLRPGIGAYFGGGGKEKKTLPPLLFEAISLSKLGKNATKKKRVSYSHRKLKLNQIIHQI